MLGKSTDVASENQASNENLCHVSLPGSLLVMSSEPYCELNNKLPYV